MVMSQCNYDVTVDVRTRPTILHMMWCSDLDQQSHRRWCYDTNQRCSILINYVTDDDGASNLINDVTHDNDVSNPVQWCYWQRSCYLTWSREWKQGSKTSMPGSRNGAGINGKANEKKEWTQIQLFRTTVSGITTNITLKSRVWIHVIPWWKHRVLSQWLKLADNAPVQGNRPLSRVTGPCRWRVTGTACGTQ